MKLIVLGNNGPYPAPGGACSSYLLQSDRHGLLLDFGTGALAALPRYVSYAALDAVILSHLHFDHMSDILPMVYALQFHPRTAPLPVLAPDAPENLRALIDLPAYELRPMRDCKIGPFDLRFMRARHPVETWAVRASCNGKSLVYTGDSNDLPALADFARGADVLLADAGLSSADWHENAPHMSAAGCARLARDAECARLLLTHLNPRYAPEALEAEAREIHPGATFTRIGAEYEI